MHALFLVCVADHRHAPSLPEQVSKRCFLHRSHPSVYDSFRQLPRFPSLIKNNLDPSPFDSSTPRPSLVKASARTILINTHQQTASLTTFDYAALHSTSTIYHVDRTSTFCSHAPCYFPPACCAGSSGSGLARPD